MLLGNPKPCCALRSTPPRNSPLARVAQLELARQRVPRRKLGQLSLKLLKPLGEQLRALGEPLWLFPNVVCLDLKVVESGVHILAHLRVEVCLELFGRRKALLVALADLQDGLLERRLHEAPGVQRRQDRAALHDGRHGVLLPAPLSVAVCIAVDGLRLHGRLQRDVLGDGLRPLYPLLWVQHRERVLPGLGLAARLRRAGSYHLGRRSLSVFGGLLQEQVIRNLVENVQLVERVVKHVV
mmetsp:Transcript_7949/g.20245  ORF Transcript_7949/g.20245 Transcript_7949/m.20245 type:complete len:240 (-) Transcript_7949:463-1182(-)